MNYEKATPKFRYKKSS